jgi:hypothetical protein
MASPAKRTFLQCMAVVAASLVGVAVLGGAGGDWSPPRTVVSGLLTLLLTLVVLLIEGLVLGHMAARRGLRTWLSGYMGSVIGSAPFLLILGWQEESIRRSREPRVGEVFRYLQGIPIVAMLLGVGFLIAGSWAWRRWRSRTSHEPGR